MPRGKDGRKAYMLAAAVELHCGNCAEPIPAPNGSFMWTEVPQTVQCRNCGTPLTVAKGVSADALRADS
jgi:hypothetical protein